MLSVRNIVDVWIRIEDKWWLLLCYYWESVPYPTGFCGLNATRKVTTEKVIVFFCLVICNVLNGRQVLNFVSFCNYLTVVVRLITAFLHSPNNLLIVATWVSLYGYGPPYSIISTTFVWLQTAYYCQIIAKRNKNSKLQSKFWIWQ